MLLTVLVVGGWLVVYVGRMWARVLWCFVAYNMYDIADSTPMIRGVSLPGGTTQPACCW